MSRWGRAACMYEGEYGRITFVSKEVVVLRTTRQGSARKRESRPRAPDGDGTV